ncbi:hypothetical protein DNFV4_04398 [Nitrospira tepida]|uniref:DUF1207 domain-containing protein n=1 Tax=Nitrospira tepida TaxID=2973512 RepID=A0AA86N3F9_9BACT|nr:DUF1207 domain-containing protein [Nitrospira tepida]CAI4033956.1 hypothetical protein DNFV4_04398 [Nitrospira tepida]
MAATGSGARRWLWTTVAAVTVVCWSGLVLAAGPGPDGSGDKEERPAVDCRYESGAAGDEATEARSKGVPFPSDDVFRPLFADPKQPQFFATYQAVRVRQANTSANIGSVGFGENFGLYSKRRGCNGWQVGILAGVFSQFNLDAPSSDLLNTDFVVGIPVSWRSGLVSLRARLYHQSSHLGDEFLLGNPGLNRVNLSFEEAEALLSLDAPGGWGRIYAGGGYLLHRTPDLERGKAQWGVELRGPTMRSLLFGETVGALRVTPVLGADFKSFEELAWNVNTNAVAGIEWSRETGTRRFRLLFNYYRGFNPYGQFFNQKIETFGVGLYLAF